MAQEMREDETNQTLYRFQTGPPMRTYSVKTGDEDSNRQRLWRVFAVVIILLVVLFLWIGSVAQEQDHPEGIRQKSAAHAACLHSCQKTRRKEHNDEYFGGSRLDRQELVRLVTAAKETMTSRLKVDYAEYFEKIFMDDATGRFVGFDSITTDDESSLERLKRKLQIKVLSVQKKATEAGCGCINEKSLSETSTETMPDSNVPIAKSYERYVWATGGHSAAAGHGNLYNESYTAYMERDLKDVFGAIGIEFEGRNYAMGGTSSGLEISMCWEQVFGGDVDIFSWDYGMTDANHDENLFHYGYRGGMTAGRPAFVVWRSKTKNREDRLKDLHSMGMATFIQNGTDSRRMRNAVPESSEISEAEIQALPSYVRNLKCQGKIESGEPYCLTEKYSKDVCHPRSHQKTWHPGFKAHAMDGHAIALFLAQTLLDAVKDLVDNSIQDPETLLLQLMKEEDELYDKLSHGELPESTEKIYGESEDDLDFEEVLDNETDTFWQGPSICKTGRLPAVSRYLGYTTNNTSKVGNFAPLGMEQYETGISLSEAKKPGATTGEMLLVYEPGGKNRQSCEVQLKPDYKDVFYSHYDHGLVKLTLLNEMERIAYSYDPSKFEGVIFLFFGLCDWGNCHDGELDEEDFEKGEFEMMVNDKPVKSIVSYGQDAFVLKGDDGFYWEPSANNDYEIGVRVRERHSYVRISSLVVY